MSNKCKLFNGSKKATGAMSARIDFPQPPAEGFDFLTNFVEFSEVSNRVTVVGLFESIGNPVQYIVLSWPVDLPGTDHDIRPRAEKLAWANLTSLRTGYATSGVLKEVLWDKANRTISGKFEFSGEGYNSGFQYEVREGEFSLAY
ncbi:hypothetical protein [Pseudomonas sichuanensis]|uniref:Uncharacterized protein n=1 Tax=Pseudomonas sichuanensis TaxID=2213015 RepID=A0ABV0DLG1_9PSED